MGEYLTVPKGERRRRKCHLCGLPDVRHTDPAACVVALRRECARLRANLAAMPLRASGQGVTLRQSAGVAGYAVAAVGGVFSLWCAFVHVALAQPLSELSIHPGFLAGLAGLLAGILLSGVPGQLSRRRSSARVPVASLAIH